jgi:lipid-binding SYLF domain-containing protein
MKRITALFVAAAVLSCPFALAAKEAGKGEAKKEAKSGDKKTRIDTMAKDTLDTLFAKSPEAKKLYDKAVAYAVFDNTKVSLLISGGGGNGVAIDKKSGARTYMKMGTAGVGIGLGAQSYQVVFLFETATPFTSFVEKGWQADASANAAAGKDGANAGATFRDGVAVYQLTDKGLMLQADIAGTKYWKNDKLN